MVTCAVFGCGNNDTKKNRPFVLHSFPKQNDIKKRWIIACRRADAHNTFFSKPWARVCSDHFDENDYRRDLMLELMNVKLKRRLKPEAVPHLKLPKKELFTDQGGDDRAREREKKNNKRAMATRILLLSNTPPPSPPVNSHEAKSQISEVLSHGMTDLVDSQATRGWPVEVKLEGIEIKDECTTDINADPLYYAIDNNAEETSLVKEERQEVEGYEEEWTEEKYTPPEEAVGMTGFPLMNTGVTDGNTAEGVLVKEEPDAVDNAKVDLPSDSHSAADTGATWLECRVCDFKTKRCQSFKVHMRTHVGEKPFACSLCKYKSKGADTLKKHMMIHTGEKPYACSFCQYKCRDSGTLKQHVMTHTGEKPFACTVCDYGCTRESRLRDHMRIHTGEKPFACNICDYTSRRRIDLKVHMRKHTREEPFASTICDYTSRHNMKRHKGEILFTCDYCNYKSRHRGTLNRHLLMHTGELPFVCAVCGYKCRRKTTLLTHCCWKKPHDTS